jgi:hypothetical protein
MDTLGVSQNMFGELSMGKRNFIFKRWWGKICCCTAYASIFS